MAVSTEAIRESHRSEGGNAAAPPWGWPRTWYLHGAAGGGVVGVRVAALHHHRLRRETAALRVCGHVLQLGDAELQQHICHLGRKHGHERRGRQLHTCSPACHLCPSCSRAPQGQGGRLEGLEFEKLSSNQGLPSLHIKQRQHRA